MKTDIHKLRSQIENIDRIPTIPSILKRLVVVIENPRVSLSEIGSFILNDPVLTSRILKMVNSPLYGFPGRISSINQALLLLGLNVVKGMLFGVSVFDAMQKTMVGLWEHSVGCAVVGKIIARKKMVSEPEEVSVAALLHDIGKVIFNLKFREEYEKVLSETRDGEHFVFEVERGHFGVDHASAGSWIAQKWSFPKSLIEPIEYHHKPHLAKNFPVNAAIVHVSDIIIRARGFGFAGDGFVPEVNPAAWELLRLSEADLEDILSELEEALSKAEDLFL